MKVENFAGIAGLSIEGHDAWQLNPDCRPLSLSLNGADAGYIQAFWPRSFSADAEDFDIEVSSWSPLNDDQRRAVRAAFAELVRGTIFYRAMKERPGEMLGLAVAADNGDADAGKAYGAAWNEHMSDKISEHFIARYRATFPGEFDVTAPGWGAHIGAANITAFSPVHRAFFGVDDQLYRMGETGDWIPVYDSSIIDSVFPASVRDELHEKAVAWHNARYNAAREKTAAENSARPRDAWGNYMDEGDE